MACQCFHWIYYFTIVVGIITTFSYGKNNKTSMEKFSLAVGILNMIALPIKIFDFATNFRYVMGGILGDILFELMFVRCIVCVAKSLFTYEKSIVCYDVYINGRYSHQEVQDNGWIIWVIKMILLVLLCFLFSFLTLIYMFVRVICIIHDISSREEEKKKKVYMCLKYGF